MRRFLGGFALLGVALLHFSCDKTDWLPSNIDPWTLTPTSSGGTGTGTTSGYYLKFKIDGKDMTANNRLIATYTPDVSKLDPEQVGFVFAVVGYTSAASASQQGLSLGIGSRVANKTFTTGTYTENDGSLDYGVISMYNPNPLSTDGVFYSVDEDNTTPGPFIIKITSKTDKEVTGTFSGNLYKVVQEPYEQSKTEKIVITDGQFKVPVTTIQ